MRVLLVNDYYSPHMVGGAEVLVQGLAAGLRARGHEVRLITARIGNTKARECIAGIDVVRVGRFPGFSRAAMISSGTVPGRLSSTTTRDFHEALRSFRPDIVHFHNVWLLGPAIIRLVSCRKGITLHDYWPICVRRSMIRVNWRPCSGPGPVACRLCRLRAPADVRSLNLVTLEAERVDRMRTLAACDFMTAPSAFMAERLATSGDIRPVVIYNGVDAGGLIGRPSQPPYALFAGRPTREKGYEIALRAFRLPSMRGYRLRVAAAVSHAGLSNVSILGQQPSSCMPRLIAGASCVIVPSIWPENCPMIVLEALRAGVPVVASRVGGIPELVADGETGILVPPGKVDDLAAGVRRCFEDGRLRRLTRHRGPAAIRERFSREQMLSRFEDLYVA